MCSKPVLSKVLIGFDHINGLHEEMFDLKIFMRYVNTNQESISLTIFNRRVKEELAAKSWVIEY